MRDKATAGASASGSPSWSGETVFVVAGGPSVADQDLECLRGRRVIAIKGQYLRLPFADVLLFADAIWWRAAPKGRDNGPKVVASGFAGEIVTTSPLLSGDPFCQRLTFRNAAKSFSEDPAALFVRRTVVTAAVNEAWHRGAAGVVLLGVDGELGADGLTHSYPDDQGRKLPAHWQDEQRKDFAAMTEATRRLGFPVFNAGPASVYDFWPRITLEELCR